jgi:hypothetical protein
METITEKLKASDPVKTWIDDFIKSTDSRFEGKTKDERIMMALGAYYDAQKNESVELEEDLSKERSIVYNSLTDEEHKKYSSILKDKNISKSAKSTKLRQFFLGLNKSGKVLDAIKVVVDNMKDSSIDEAVITNFNDFYTQHKKMYPSHSEEQAKSAWGKYKEHFAKKESSVDEALEKATGGLGDACWKGYTAVGTKEKDGKKVPNCVPVKEEDLDELSDDPHALSLMTNYEKMRDKEDEVRERKRKVKYSSDRSTLPALEKELKKAEGSTKYAYNKYIAYRHKNAIYDSVETPSLKEARNLKIAQIALASDGEMVQYFSNCYDLTGMSVTSIKEEYSKFIQENQ